MSPILVRPVREQLEHDRVIRLLQVKLKRKHEVIANIGEDQSTSVKIGQLQVYPDLVLTTADKGRKLMGTVEVETSESVNHLEARSQWAHLGRARAPFYLYVPAGSVDQARRLATENHVHVSELWSFHTIGDQTHFRMVHRTPDDTRRSSEPRGIVTSNKPEVPVTSPLKPLIPAPPVVAAKAPVDASRKADGSCREEPGSAGHREESRGCGGEGAEKGSRSGARRKCGGGEEEASACSQGCRGGDAQRAGAQGRPSPSSEEKEVVLPYLRFNRDKNGYENTFVVDSDRRRGRSRTRVLYWFRTPPGVKVGRAALDEEAIRLIEQLNPGVDFEWTKILKGQGTPATESRPPAEVRRQRPRPAPSNTPPAPQPRPAAPAPQPVNTPREELESESVMPAPVIAGARRGCDHPRSRTHRQRRRAASQSPLCRDSRADFRAHGRSAAPARAESASRASKP